ncbi:MAG: flagellar basal-body MS-ring/collar protein FliF, partial [Gammaproteobacteria bacterium]|nr:flagellar basal-body MS-ring/collar protein FliF [Gammaproteobacteria bacterium]
MSEAAATNPFAVFDNIPGFRQLAMLVGLALSISFGVTAAFWFAEPTYSMLYSNVSDREAGEIIDVLNGSEIPHKLDNRTGAILVAEDHVHDARLKLASQGLPRGTGFGLEIIEGETGFSTSQFMENARYHHAIETELARTIGNLRPVQYARVHLAEARSTVFLRKKDEASASVFLYLYPGRNLEKAQVSSIIHLVASSIPNLESNKVTVVDQQGRLLNSPESDSEFTRSNQQLEQLRNIENTYVQRIEALLTPMLGQDRVRATVTAQVDFTVREETREQYDRDNAAIRSEQVAENRQMGAASLGGIPGALSNQPPSAAASEDAATAGEESAEVEQAANPVNESLKRIRNYELDRTLSHTRQQTGAVSRLSVAVLVDDKRILDEKGKMSTEPMTSEELVNLEKLIKDAVGFDESRGDSVSVSNVAFFNEPDPEPLEEEGFFSGVGMRGL